MTSPDSMLEVLRSGLYSGAFPVSRSADELVAWFESALARTERALNDALADAPGVPARLAEAMRYPCFPGGKRMRPLLVLASGAAACPAPDPGRESACDAVAAAVEMIHAHSLALDDLPAMDDDQHRRGRPALHIAFDEATAILAANALLLRAQELLIAPGIDPALSVRLLRELSVAIGRSGAIAGQLLDLGLAGSGASRADDAEQVNRLKTAVFAGACCRCGAFAVGADDESAEHAAVFGVELGLAFQALDDALDEVADMEVLGKPTGSDRRNDKVTLSAKHGLPHTLGLVEEHARRAAAAIAPFGPAADPLRVILAVAIDKRLETARRKVRELEMYS
ncbi:MAG TPA: polyprenyl synthetase family protein [Kiritimatiellia bacterium]|nr:polyprenyl synthetase family protein [Kiritimatiellia bacterium]